MVFVVSRGVRGGYGHGLFCEPRTARRVRTSSFHRAAECADGADMVFSMTAEGADGADRIVM